ncbi:MAG: hypothetical protein K6F09_02875 [Clostridiales bacterium]|nr:hypothetical protein [Clostridiales bacterium]
MKITYYGTAAAEGVPALFCYCPLCERARAEGGKNIRTRSQALINDDLLIDFPPDTYMHELFYNMPLRDIENILITHGHSDHLYHKELENYRPPFARNRENLPVVKVYSSHKTARELMEILYNDRSFGRGFVEQRVVEKFKPFNVGKYTVTALDADHAKELEPLIYLISDGEKTLLYAHDTGDFPENTWKYLEFNKPHIDFASLDCTHGICPGKSGHMGLPADIEVRDKLKELGCADDTTVFCINHFSHNGLLTYDEMKPVAEKEGFITSYDTMSVEF